MACALMLVGAYWTGQTYGTVIKSFRDAYEGPDPALDDLENLLCPRLPIDVEH
jgi:hypothetical protein